MPKSSDPTSTAIRNGIIIAAILGAVLIVEARHVFDSKDRVSMLTWGADLNKAFGEAQKSGKPVMVDFNATWCEPCQEYKDELFDTPDFKSRASNFELVDIDIDEQADLATKYRVDGIPDIRFFDSSGNQIKQVVGFEGPALLDDMDAALGTNKKKSQG